MTLPTRRSLIAAALAGLALAPGPAGAQETQDLTRGFTSGGVPITVERFDGGRVSGRRPAVLLLHGSDGPGRRYQTAALQVARGGYAVFLVHYLDRTGERRASRAAIGSSLPLWTQTARDALTFIAAQPGVDPNRLGVFGISLGGGIALALAQQDPRVRAVVDYFGFVPPSVTQATRLPPTLILHGAEDRVVPVTNAYALQEILRRTGSPHETQIYPGQGHGFTGEAEADAARRITAFLGRTLGRSRNAGR